MMVDIGPGREMICKIKRTGVASGRWGKDTMGTGSQLLFLYETKVEGRRVGNGGKVTGRREID
jgi:hypothetical protein